MADEKSKCNSRHIWSHTYACKIPGKQRSQSGLSPSQQILQFEHHRRYCLAQVVPIRMEYDRKRKAGLRASARQSSTQGGSSRTLSRASSSI